MSTREQDKRERNRTCFLGAGTMETFDGTADRLSVGRVLIEEASVVLAAYWTVSSARSFQFGSSLGLKSSRNLLAIEFLSTALLLFFGVSTLRAAHTH